MDFLGIKDSTASRPSLISSMWSLQVQPQQDATTIMDIQMGSQQSLPEMPSTAMETDYFTGMTNEQSNSIRPSKSLSELSQFFKDSRTFRIHEAPSFVWKRQQTPQNSTMNQQSRAPTQQDSTLSRQQKERNICEWLEQLNCSDTGPRNMPISPSSNLNFQSNQMSSPSSLAQKPPQFPKTTPMQHY